jgi:PTS system ascorbate-specific IIA component
VAAIVIIAHAPLASALVAAARHVYSRDPNAASVRLCGLDVAADASIPEVLAEASAIIARVDQGQGVLVLTDVVGATPANVAVRLARPGQVEVLAGVNLPMLLRSLCYSDSSPAALLAKAAEGGARGVQPLAPAPPAGDGVAPPCNPEDEGSR